MHDSSKQFSTLSTDEKRSLLAQLVRRQAREHHGWESLSLQQKGLWLHWHLTPESTAYNLLFSLRVQAPLDVAALREASQKLAERHPLLTATYVFHDGEPMQKLSAESTLPFEEIAADQWEMDELKQRITHESNLAIDLDKGPLFRILLYKRSAQDWAVAFITHHIIVDFWAVNALATGPTCIAYRVSSCNYTTCWHQTTIFLCPSCHWMRIQLLGSCSLSASRSAILYSAGTGPDRRSGSLYDYRGNG